MRTFVSAKIQGVTVTDASVDYNGSVGVDRELLACAGIRPFEQVTVVNLSTGARWVTYAIALDEPGAFTLNGGGARLGVVGDRCVLMSWQTAAEMLPAKVLHVSEHSNREWSIAEYQPDGSMIDVGFAIARRSGTVSIS